MSLSGSLTELDWLQMLNGGGVIRNSEADSNKKEPPDAESLGVEAISFGTDVEMKEVNEETTEAETNGDKCEQQVEDHNPVHCPSSMFEPKHTSQWHNETDRCI